MKTRYLFLLVMLLLAFSLIVAGCSTAPKAIDPNYMAYQQAISNQKPMISIEWSDDGQKLKKLEVSHPLNIQQIQPEQPHPGWGVATALIKGATVVGGIVAAGDALEGLAGAVQGNTNVVAGGHIAGGGISIPTTTTTNTTTSTEQTLTAPTITETTTNPIITP